MEGIKELDPFEGMSDEELDAMAEAAEADGGAAQLDGPSGAPEGFRSGFVALVGRPNAGKSTLLNACYGKKVAITSPVAQTTRRRLRAVVNRPGCQLVIVDTPGLHKPKDGLGSELKKTALNELSDVDVIAFVIDASAPIGSGDAWVAERVAAAKAPKVLVLTKADRADQAGLVSRYLPQGPKWFPDDMGTDEPDEVLVAEFVREKVLLRTREEVPHSVGVLCDAFERPKRDLLRLHATVYVEREGQKGILVGRGGDMIKRIGTEARRDLERMFGCRVFLGLDVRVKPGWRDDEREIRRFGYAADDE